MALSQDEFKERVNSELKEALTYFIERQKLVAQAMTEMGLDLNEVAQYGALAWVSTLPPDKNGKVVKSVDAYSEYENSDNEERQKWYQVAKRASERNLPQTGIWHDSEQNEWEYTLHGGGCRLVNTKTGEPINWDPPDVNSYDTFKFMYNLKWQISFPERATKLSTISFLVTKTIEPFLKEIQGENFSI